MNEITEAEIQNLSDEAEREMQNATDSEEYNKAREKVEEYQRQLQAIREGVAVQKKELEIEIKLEEAKENGYLLDTLYTADGTSMAELSFSPENHELVCIAVQKAFLAQQDAFNRELDELQLVKTMWMSMANSEKVRADQYEHDLYTLGLAHKETEQKLANAAAIIEEKDAEIQRLKEQQNQAQAVEVAPLSAEEQEAKLINELNGKRIKVYNLRAKSEAFNNKHFLANYALTGEEFEDYLLYSKRYEEITEAAAAELRADFQAKKDAIAKANEMPVLEIFEEVAIEEQADTQENVPPIDNGGNEELAGDKSFHEVVEQAEQSEEVNTSVNVEWYPIEIPVTRTEFDSLTARVEALEQRINTLN